jgi:ketosteroid isomerase-like protein
MPRPIPILCIAAIVTVLAPPLAHSQGAPDGAAARQAWVAGIAADANRDPGAVPTEAEREYFRRFMIEYFKSWAPGTARFDIAVPAPWYRQDAQFWAFDFLPPAEGFSGWPAYAEEISRTLHGFREFRIEPLPETFRYGRRGEVAWMSMAFRPSGVLASGQAFGGLVARTSLVLERDGDRWLIVHEHVSAPLPR